ncbi:MAG: cardiolipin synthase [Clostridia bacterium]|nr:cardiolipin synthase [Clostridia bacterium]
MKLLKILLGRPLLILLSLLVQANILLLVFLYFNAYFLAFQIVSTILGLLLFLHMLNKYECPEFKLPWLLMILVLPYFGMMLYLLLAMPYGDARQKRYFKARFDQRKASLPPEWDEKSVKNALGDHAGISRYLTHFCQTHPHTENKVDYFSCGEDFHRDLLAELEKAERFIFMEYFIIEPGIMWESIHAILRRKIAAGVEVRMLYDDVGNLGKTGARFYKQLQKEGIQCYKFNPIRPVLSGIHNNRDHRKITVIDGRVAYTGGINIGDEYINQKQTLGHWKDTAIKLCGSAVNDFTCLFLELFDLCSHHVTDPAHYLCPEPEHFPTEGAVQPFGDGPRPYNTEPIAENAFIQMISTARQYVYITTPYLVTDHNLTTALRNAAARGVDVRIVTPHIPDKRLIFWVTRSHYKPLLESGVRIYEYTPGFIHAKTLLCDGKVAFVGTVNMDYRSLVHHFECGALLYDTPCIEDINADLKQTLARSHEITAENFRMNGLASLACSFLAVFFPLL